MSGHVLVTGGAAGIGRAVAERLRDAGYSVAVQHRSSEPPQGVDAVYGDFSSQSGICDFLERYSAAYPNNSALVHCVGSYSAGPLTRCSDAQWAELMNSNFHAARQLTIGLRETVKSVVYMGMAGLVPMRAGGQAPAYMIVKQALWNLCIGFARELGPEGIRVNMVSPYWTERSVGYPEDVQRAVPLGRLGRLDEIAEAVQFLLEADYVSGQNLEVSGGAGL